MDKDLELTRKPNCEEDYRVVDRVLEEIKKDVAVGDMTAICELLMFSEMRYLIGYLPEDLDAEDDPNYHILNDYEDIIGNAPEFVTQYFRELPLDRQLLFIQMNPEGNSDGRFNFTDEMILEKLSEPLVDSNGDPTACRCIIMALNIDEYVVTYSKFGYIISSVVFDTEEDADEYFAALAKEHPKCKITGKL
jgi:hypothetical protein